MSPTVLPTARRMSGLTGRHVLIAFLAFFGVIFAVNGVLLWKALSTLSGLVAQEPYRKGLTYNQRVAADERQQALGWSDSIGLDTTGRLDLALVDAAGRPVRGLLASAVVGRPSTVRHDHTVRLAEVAPGRYIAGAGPLDTGAWIVSVELRADAGGDAIYRLRRRLWLKP